MSKAYSSAYDRAMHMMVILHEAQNNLPAGIISERARTPKELADTFLVERQTVHISIRLLETWNFIDKYKKGRNSVYYLTADGYNFLQRHEGYVRERAEANQQAIDANLWR